MPLFEDKPAYNSLTRWMLGIVIASTLVIGLVLIPFDILGTWIMFGATALIALLLWFTMPRRFLVYEDRLTIKQGGPFAIHIFYPDMIRVHEADREETWSYWGLKLATSSKYVVEIERKNGLGILISPSSEREFIEQVNMAKNNYREPDFDALYEKMMK